jgi:hypothetical protein
MNSHKAAKAESNTKKTAFVHLSAFVALWQ